MHVHKGYIYKLNHSQPSGNPWTSVINTVYNLILLDFSIHAAVLQSKQEYPIKLDTYYHAYVYGDDNFLIFNEILTKLITPLDITRIMTQTGHSYTSETKTEQTDYRTLTEISILKRSFRYDQTRAYCFAPLDYTVWLELLNWDKEVTMAKKLSQLFINTDTVQRELAHHDEFTYHKYWDNLILPVLRELGYSTYSSLPYRLLNDQIARSFDKISDNLFF
jgi:hypothetical protein